MFDRREIVTTGLAASVSAVMTHAEPASQSSSAGDADLRRAVEDLRAELRQLRLDAALPSTRSVDAVRQAIRTYLKANGKYPDYVDVGIDAWDSIYEWHVRVQQPIRITSTTENRLGLVLILTTVVMRPDLSGEFVGQGYDVRTA